MTEENILKPGERLDDLQLSGYHIIQDPQRFCFGVDAVLLTDFAKVKPGGTAFGSRNGNRRDPDPAFGKDERLPLYRTGDPAGERGHGKTKCFV